MTASIKQGHAANIWLPRAVRIEEVAVELPKVWTLRVTPEEGDFPTFLPGQFNMLYLPGIGEAAISISSGCNELPTFSHTVRAVGNVTLAISQLLPGQRLGLRGPFGNPWPLPQLQGRDLLIVAGGVGLAPLRPAIRYLLANLSDFGRIKLIYGAKSPAELLYQREFASWQDAGIEVEATVDQGTSEWKGHIGVVTELMRPSHATPEGTSVLTCGPEIMMRFVAREAILSGIDPNQIYVSLERNMKCAMGMCGVCQFGPEFICQDGPVFPFSRVSSFMKLVDL